MLLFVHVFTVEANYFSENNVKDINQVLLHSSFLELYCVVSSKMMFCVILASRFNNAFDIFLRADISLFQSYQSNSGRQAPGEKFLSAVK